MSYILPSSQRALLLDFFYIGAGNAIQTFSLTNWVDELDVDGRTYTPTPAIEVELPQYTVEITDQAARVRMADTISIFRTMALGRAFPEVDCRIREICWDPENAVQAEIITLWQGKIAKNVVNPSGNAGTVQFEVDGCGGTLDRVINPTCGELCYKTFGSQGYGGCKVDRDNTDINIGPVVAYTGTITAVSAQELTVTGLPTDQRRRHFVNGDVNLNGSIIRIRQWDAVDPTRVLLAELPPEDFVSGVFPVTATFRAGCQYDIVSCRFWQNELRFGGLGLQMPLRDPNLEVD